MKKKKIIYILSSFLACCGNVSAHEIKQKQSSVKEKVLVAKDKQNKNSYSNENSVFKYVNLKNLIIGSAASWLIYRLGKATKEYSKNKNRKVVEFLPPAPPPLEKPKDTDKPNDPSPGPGPKSTPTPKPKLGPAPVPKPNDNVKSASDVTEEVSTDKLHDWDPVNFTGSSCFLNSLSKLMYNPKTAAKGIYEKYSKMAEEQIKEELKKYFKKDKEKLEKEYAKKFEEHIDCDGLYKGICLDPPTVGNGTTQDDVDKYNFAANLFYASVINRSAYYNYCYEEMKKKEGILTTSLGDWGGKNMPVKANEIKFGKWNLDLQLKDVQDSEYIKIEQLFHGNSYKLNELYENIRNGGTGDLCAVVQGIVSGGLGLTLSYPTSLHVTDHILEPDAHYMTIQDKSFEEIIKYKKKVKDENGNEIEIDCQTEGKVKNGFSALKLPVSLKQPKIKDGKIEKDKDNNVRWEDDKEEWANVSENGEVDFNGKKYVIVGVSTASGGHCLAFEPKFFSNDGNIELAGWLDHSCGPGAHLRMVKPNEKLTIQQLLSHCKKYASGGGRAGMVIKFVPKEDVLNYHEYYCVNQYKNGN